MTERPSLETLLARSRDHEPTAAEREEQRRSFAYGNIAIENSNVTREMIDHEADALG